MKISVSEKDGQTDRVFVDINGPEVVQVDINRHNNVWVNVNGVCVLRIQSVLNRVTVNDERNRV